MSDIINHEVMDYIRNLLPPRDELFLEMEREAKEKIIP
ncbi:hypothetical protein N752_11135 [Desulforamulus aquiferis]|nr:hypothetical protein N752_11135 [Desulforamulus aquiferis]